EKWGLSANNDGTMGVFNPELASVRQTGDPLIQLRVNGVSEALSNSTTAVAGTGAASWAWYIGQRGESNQYWNGPISSILFYNRALSDDDISKAEAYLAARYQIQLP